MFIRITVSLLLATILASSASAQTVAGKSSSVLTTTIVKTDSSSQTTVSDEDAFALTKEGAKYKLKLATLNAKIEKARAKYAQPKDLCGGWNPPIACRGYGYGGGYGYGSTPAGYIGGEMVSNSTPINTNGCQGCDAYRVQPRRPF